MQILVTTKGTFGSMGRFPTLLIRFNEHFAGGVCSEDPKASWDEAPWLMGPGHGSEGCDFYQCYVEEKM